MYFSQGDHVNIRNQYYRTFAGEADISSDERMLIANCSGYVLSDVGFYNNNVRRDFYLMYMTEGSINISFGEQNEELEKGSLLIMEPGTRFIYEAQKGVNTGYYWVHFTGSEVCEILSSLGIKTGSILKIGVHMTLKELFKSLWQCFIGSGERFFLTSGATLSYILSKISDYCESSGKRFFKTIEYINTHYGENIKISKLAEDERMSEANFRRIFREVTGKSPSEYIQTVRINAAASLLESTDGLLSEISAMCGFYDEYYFGKVFKKYAGVTPGVFRRNIKDKNRDFR